VTSIVKEHFGKHFEPLTGDNTFNSYSELDNKLHKFTVQYKNKTMSDIASELGLQIPKEKSVNKSIAEQIVARMFGAKSKKLRSIDTFSKLGIIPKTIIQNDKKQRTEDMKFETIDFNEWSNPAITFENSYIYNFFANQTMLYIIFRETKKDSPILDTVFKGFKRLQFDDDILQRELRPVWEKIREMAWNNEIKVSTMYDKSGDILMTKKTKIPMERTNLPKSKDYNFFVRGTGVDATGKTFTLNGYNMYNQYIWLKGSIIISILSNIEYI